jgi:hypothetical protein
LYSATANTTVGYLDNLFTYGMGLLTADVLTVAAGGKSFGALGEGNLKTNAGVDIASTVTTYGSKFAKEVTGACDASYQILTVIPKSSQPGSKTFTATFGSYDWKYNFVAPTPSVYLRKTFTAESVLGSYSIE